MADQPTPRAPEDPRFCTCGAEAGHAGSKRCPPTPNLREQIAGAMHSADNHIGPVCAICRYQADAVIDLLRRNGVIR